MEPTKENIEEFGEYDYDRLVENEQEDVQHICNVPADLKEFAAKLKELIQQGRIHIMDKESGVAFRASVVIGFDENGLLIANER